jgi:Ca2+-binding EF-hand superfamily protein
MGSGVSKSLLPNAHKRAKTRSQRQITKETQQEYEQQIIKLFASICDADEGRLDRDKIRKMCEILFHDIDPALGTVTEEDVDEVMMIGEMSSKEADHHITVDEIPKALSTIMAIKKDKQKIHDLFLRHDVDGSKCLSSAEISELLSELNDGIIPSKSDVEFIIDKCGGPNASVSLAHLKPAIEIWYVLVAQGPLPTTVEEAKEYGYTEEQITSFVIEAKEAGYTDEEISNFGKEDGAAAAESEFPVTDKPIVTGEAPTAEEPKSATEVTVSEITTTVEAVDLEKPADTVVEVPAESSEEASSSS